jgi:type VI secretion system Hcp family effector
MADIYLKIDNIKGQSTDDKHKEWIEILSWNWGVTNSVELSSGRSAVEGQAHFQNLSLVKAMDASSMKIWESLAKGQDLGKVTLELCRTAGKKDKFLVIEMEGGVYLTSYSISGGGGGEPTENFTLDYAKIKTTYHKQAVAGGAPAGNIPAGWNRLANTPF